MSERVLVISAHCDDESFGCLGVLLKHKEAGDMLGFVWFTDSFDSRGLKQREGATKCSSYFNAKYIRFLDYPDQKLDNYAITTIIKSVEETLSSFKPTIVYCPFIADLNRDHRIVAEASMVGCRPYKENSPNEVWMYMIQGTTELGLRPMRVDRCENIDEVKKQKLLKLWYPNELINGRDIVENYEMFEKWPRD